MSGYRCPPWTSSALLYRCMHIPSRPDRRLTSVLPRISVETKLTPLISTADTDSRGTPKHGTGPQNRAWLVLFTVVTGRAGC